MTSLMHMPESQMAQRQSVAPVRRCACGNIVGPDGECSTCRAKRLMGKMGSSGKSLEQPVRSTMEQRFGQNFSNVRIHADAEAGRAAESANAAAFTIGQNIVFGAGRFAPNTHAGSNLLAHELAHTVQQRNAVAGPSLAASSSHAEGEASSAAVAATSGGLMPALSPVPSLSMAKQDPKGTPPPDAGTGGTTTSTPTAAPTVYPSDEPNDTPEQRQYACLIKRGNCGKTSPGGGPPEPRYIAMENVSCKPETSYSGPDIWPSPKQCSTPQLFAFDAIKLARSLATKYPGWLSVLPACPCTDAVASKSPDWVGPGACQPPYHIGAATGYRSAKGYASVPGTNHGQQCCYDKAGNLITEGAGAGTPDVVQAPAGVGAAIGGIFSSGPGPVAAYDHYYADVVPFNELGWEIYNRYWVPNKGVGCPPNKVP
jgi:hypothetical protein